MSDTPPHFPIYMDYGATTPVDPRVVEAMIPWLGAHFGNPASRSHAWGWEAEEAVEKARQQVADRYKTKHNKKPTKTTQNRAKSCGPRVPPNRTTSPSRAPATTTSRAVSTSSP